MELSQESCEVLGRDALDQIVVKYDLTDYPTIQWTKLFNRMVSIIQIKSVTNSKSIIVTAEANVLSNSDVAAIIIQKIDATDNELVSDALKNQIILDNFITGLIVIHDNMEYTEQVVTDENPDGKSEYELYLISIIERIQEHDAYEDMLNENLAEQ